MISNAEGRAKDVKVVDINNRSTWLLEFNFYFEGFQIDPSQDLIILAGVESFYTGSIYIRSCSLRTGRQHKRVRYKFWENKVDGVMCRDTAEIVLGILDDLLVIQVRLDSSEASEISIHDWKSGTRLNRIPCGPSCTFGFLTPDSLFVFNSSDDHSGPAVALLIYDTIRHPTAPWRYQPQIHNPYNYTPLTPHFQLDFPELPPGSYACLSVRAELAPTVTAAFAPLPTARIIQLSMTVNYHDGDEPDYYDICLSREKLLHLFSLEHLLEQGQSLIKLGWEV
ncbi:hypothetical protein BDV93DRAFT_523345 [Ceratobasidium sp. AG-I]|nr:hypothetical protein BDV93DRAFT_523345 [Ceratobasidium sp. AG-I]